MECLICPMQTFQYLQEAYSFDVKLGEHHANAGEGTSNKRQEGHQCGIISKCTEKMTDLSSIVAILFKHTMEVLQFSWDTLLFTDGSSYACQS
jgi:hypothetical protein